ncbi:hypothetical protein [Isoptericola sp. NPDC056134]|uniref:hypothetical protein n=1 Tax=Isoptericola sp. NPDC056134 TaxID=3345723 RepID=UPI0035E8F8D5
MTTWRETNARRRAERVEDIVAHLRAQAAAGYSLFAAARERGQSARTLRRWLNRHDHHDLVVRLERNAGGVRVPWWVRR